ncbi:MAG: hypothetical protein Q8Q25_02645 [bacterium]|nr:hypothetical protein [bacterium]
MNSIMEEASSVIKAIEKGWIRAGKPHHFSIKILEEPEKNFLGLTTKSAKVALLFEDKPTVVSHHPAYPPKKPFKYPSRPEQPEIKPTTPPPLKKEAQQKEIQQPERPVNLWSEEMVEASKTWIKQTLVHMGLSHINFKTIVVGRNLKIEFHTTVLENNRQEKFLFSSLAHLLLETLRNKYKRHLRNIGVILTTTNTETHETPRT